MDIPVLMRELVLLLVIASLVIAITRKLSVPYTLGLVVAGVGLGLSGWIPDLRLDPDLVLFVLLPPLLFEGAWSVKLSLLRENWRAIFFLAGPGLLLSLGILAVTFHFFDGLDWIVALLLAAALSPTDPVAVLGLFRQLHVNERLSNIIEGESLFNDGVAGSLYQTFLAVALLTVQGKSGGVAWFSSIGTFALEAGVGLLVGLLVGFGISQLLRRLDDALLETTITVVTAYGTYLLADELHGSGIIAVIVTALLLGNYGQRVALSQRTKAAIDSFWTMIAFLANALIFLLVGVQLNPQAFLPTTSVGLPSWIIALLAIGFVLLARLILVGVLTVRNWVAFPRRNTSRCTHQPLPRSWLFIIFWSGLRGALSLALVQSLPLDFPRRDVLLVSCYAVVLFTLLVQGLSMRWILQPLLTPAHRPKEPPTEEVDERVIVEEEQESPA
ncbi:CPA1 family monovalent cation:H+ antiporter [Thermosporothrix hazakensis]|jgi:CPA1 family monovalent cation:H+ antiporter|uniref:CPA1 family monovalent cation:H+ antiporter n=2 Tax=Thermosporothrix TaxID=768650 RepID=A0A326U9J6_THEHA|nr:sodium:proton antiporter [Thermosporothrix hazakensis]PZW32761.1 CPA1 family monovalent cation:H+ antiporter [Thermosporothrix hazakensis]BBH87677.1 hypothetical protein KTC_24280 [Thermosporothrix sp. COM3]GCE50119.1 hypothetical protein KTH_49880 [Thermosporothrix hazakensis]